MYRDVTISLKIYSYAIPGLTMCSFKSIPRTTRIPERETPVYWENLRGPLTLNLVISKTNKAFLMWSFPKVSYIIWLFEDKGSFSKKDGNIPYWGITFKGAEN